MEIAFEMYEVVGETTQPIETGDDAWKGSMYRGRQVSVYGLGVFEMALFSDCEMEIVSHCGFSSVSFPYGLLWKVQARGFDVACLLCYQSKGLPAYAFRTMIR